MSKRAVVLSSQFKRDLKKQFIETATAEWAEAIYCLVNDLELPTKYRDHQLSGDFKDCRDCHIKPDLVLIYTKKDNILQLVRLGSHSELF